MAVKKLLIVESPAKAKTINKILGKDFTVKASIGHIRDLPDKEFGVDIENNFAPKYVVIPGKEKIIEELRKAAKKADMVYLAPDPDREGEAIAWHISEVIGDGDKIYRVTFNEITERAVREAIKHPSKIDQRKVEAQQARRILDRIVGYKLSPLLWKKIKKGLSAGRVQSVALRMVVEREREIEAFEPKEYWTIKGLFSAERDTKEIEARLYRYEDSLVVNREKEEFLIQDEKRANEVVSDLLKRQYRLDKIEKKTRKRSAPQPFITSSLQQEASRRLKFSPKKTMMIAQQLYEGIELGEEGSVGLITYMRTDSTRISDEAKEAARELIKDRFGQEYVIKEEKKKRKISKAKIQDAHEAIRPTYIDKLPETIKPFLTQDQYRLYKLIWMRFMASQMAPAQIEETIYTIKDIEGKAEFRAQGNILRFPGFLKVYSSDDIEKQGHTLPPLKEKTPLDLRLLEPEQHFTQPPPRYTEASLVKALEEKGVGRPSTYATIISTIQERRYVKKSEGKLHPTELGKLVNDYLVDRFPELIDVGFTAKMEEELDRVEEGTYQWTNVIDEFYSPFSVELEKALEERDKVIKDKPTDLKCPECGKPLVKRWGRHGWFYACTGYPECRFTMPVNKDEKKKGVIETDETCPECGSKMVIKEGRFGRFLACSRYPECKTTKDIPTGVKCPIDGADIVERRSRKGKRFWSCSNWPKCQFALWQMPVNESCPECGASYLLEKRKNGKVSLVCPEKECKYEKTVEEKC